MSHLYHHISFVVAVTLLFAAAVNGQTPAPAAAQTTHSTFTDAAGANLPTQKIGPNDLLAISVYDAPEFSRTVRVSADGLITLPMMKHPIQAAGFMPAQLETHVADSLKKEDLLNDPLVIITVSEYQSRPIAVTGAVKSPLTFQAIGQVTVLDAINRAGGLAPEAGGEILIIPSQTTNPTLVRRISAKTLLADTDPKLNVLLEGGEEIRIPPAGRIFIIGNVRQTGSFPIQDQSDTMVMDALTLAGGFTNSAPKEAYIIRLDENSQTKHQISIPMKEIYERKVPDVPLMAHDILFIPNNKASETFAALEKVLGFGASSAILVNLAK